MNSENINSSVSTESDEISLKELILKIREWWTYLLSKWFVILLCGLIGGGLGFAYAFSKNAVYTATTTFVLEDEKGSGGLGGLAGLASMAGVDLGSSGGGIFQGDNILALYRSRTMLMRTLLTPIKKDGKTELLVENYIGFNKLREKWLKQPQLAKVQFSINDLEDNVKLAKPSRLRDSILSIIIKDLNANYLSVSKPDKKSSIIQVDVKSENEFFAKSFNDELVRNVNEFYINTKTKKTLHNVQILQHKADSVRAVMNGAIFTAVAVGDATPNLNPTRQIQRVAPVQKAQFSAETNKAILAEMVKNLEMTKMALLKETPLIQMVDHPVFPLGKEKLGILKGVVLGAFLLVFIILFYLILLKIFKEAMKGGDRKIGLYD